MFEHKFPLFFGIIDKDCIQNARPKADTTLNIFPKNLLHDVRRKERVIRYINMKENCNLEKG